MRIFLSEGRHFPLSEYANNKIPPKISELEIYTWLDATLGELTGLIRELDKFQAKGTQFSFNVVFPDAFSPNYRMRPIGLTIGGKKGPDDDITLAKCRYQIGDFVDVAILAPGDDASQVNDHLNKNRSKHRGGDLNRGRVRSNR